MSDRLELGFRAGDGVATQAQLLADGPGSPDLSSAILLLDHDAAPVWPVDVTIGDLPRTVVQFEAAADRLDAGETASVRQGVDDHAAGIHLLLEPDGDSVRASMAVVEDPEWRHQYPAAWWGDNEAWYAHLAAHRNDFTTPPDDGWRRYWFAGVAFDRAALVEALRREAARGRALHDALGVEFDETRFE